MNVVINAKTNGLGYWSEKVETITVVELTSDYINDEQNYMSLQARFLTDNWNVDKDGLIYTDENFIKDFKKGLVEHYGFSKEAVKFLFYSEQGAQGDDYVDFEASKQFVTEWVKITKGE